MCDHVNEKDFHLMVMLVALAMCFKPQEEYLSEDQVITRGFSPVDSYTRICIAKLIDTGAVEFKMAEPDFQLNGVDNILYIKRPVSSDQLDDFIYRKSEKIKGLLSRSCINGSYLQALIQEISACECIEYAMYYAGKASMKVTCQSPSNAKLKLLVMENTTEIVNALLWRAIKQISKDRGKRETVAFEEIVDLTFETYVRYKKSNIQIEGYKFPNQIRPSVMAGLLELYRTNLNF
ncbi:hypothetical protein [Cellvibrio sp. pealriver]|uniref:hypothetical protein n=1 Tax=Cellvibrio sp. pealriver TaxID=1622269 RepID=UPI00066FF1EE|nr:hypothetical protein [Cellvibrio sp. pealriver]